MVSSTEALASLARYRQIGARESVSVLKLGKQVLLAGTPLGDQEWAIREQVAIAALDLGDLKLAKQQILILNNKFPSSPRLAILQAMSFEAAGEYSRAQEVYESLLEDDWCNVTAHQRRISLLLYHPSPIDPSLTQTPLLRGTTPDPSTQNSESNTTILTTQPSLPTPTTSSILKTLPILIDYLTIFQTDPSGWGLLADLYILLSGIPGWGDQPQAQWEWLVNNSDTKANGNGVMSGNGFSGLGSTGKKSYLEQAMNCLSQRMLLEAADWVVLVRFGEVAMMNGDIPLAYKSFLRAIEMASNPTSPEASWVKASSSSKSDSLVDVLSLGANHSKVWWLLKACTLILSSPSYNQPTNTLATTSDPLHVSAIDGLAEERLDEIVGKENRIKGVEGLKRLM